MSFRNGNTLQAEYMRLRVERGRHCLLGFLFGTLGLAFVTGDAGVSLLGGFLLSVFIGTWKSFEIEKLEKIIYPGGKR